jgi:hypothetical protein
MLLSCPAAAREADLHEDEEIADLDKLAGRDWKFTVNPDCSFSAPLVVQGIGTIDTKGVFLDGGQEYCGLAGGLLYSFLLLPGAAKLR